MKTKVNLSIVLLVFICIGLVLSGCSKKSVVREEPSSQRSENTVTLNNPTSQKDVSETVKKETAEAPLVREEESKVLSGEPSQREPEKVSVALNKPGTEGEDVESHMLKDVYFDYDKYEIRPEDAEILRENAFLMMKHAIPRIQVEGHCDERGTSEYNLALGERRANSVKDYLLSLGIEANRISTISYGEEKPFVAQHDEESWAKNRRGHLVTE